MFETSADAHAVQQTTVMPYGLLPCSFSLVTERSASLALNITPSILDRQTDRSTAINPYVQEFEQVRS
jgi:hypothetical protein